MKRPFRTRDSGGDRSRDCVPGYDESSLWDGTWLFRDLLLFLGLDDLQFAPDQVQGGFLFHRRGQLFDGPPVDEEQMKFLVRGDLGHGHVVHVGGSGFGLDDGLDDSSELSEQSNPGTFVPGWDEPSLWDDEMSLWKGERRRLKSSPWRGEIGP